MTLAKPCKRWRSRAVWTQVGFPFIQGGDPGGRLTDRWVLACDLRAGDELLPRHGAVVPIESVQLDEVAEKVYNSTVAELQNYAVGGWGVLVHNTNDVPRCRYHTDSEGLAGIQNDMAINPGRAQCPGGSGVNVATRFSKTTALKLFCSFREAERSVHHALTCRSQWVRFVAYYGEAKQRRIADLIGLLHDAGAVPDKSACRESLLRDNIVTFVCRITAWLVNPLRESWAFSAKENSFFAATFEHLLNILRHSTPPPQEELIDLRFDCLGCHTLIERKLVGVAEIRKGCLIEHWFQSSYVNHVTFQEMGIPDQ